MFSSVIFKKIFLPVSACTVGIVYAKEQENCDPSRKLVRACDLPVYRDDKKICVECVANGTPPPEENLFTETVKCARKELWFLMDQARIVRNQMGDLVVDLKANSENVISFLREESNLVPRVGAIVVGGLTGYILAIRKGFIRKILYTTAGTAGMAALCYPKEAQIYYKEGSHMIKKYFIIGYHFLNGVSRDLTGYQLPPLPNGHFVISDSAHPGQETVPSSAHILPPTASPTHIPLPHEDPHEMNVNKSQKKSEE